jgi:uncharacterized protein YlaI
MMEMFSRIKYGIGLLIILIVSCFFIPGVFGVSQNDACFDSMCHDSTSNKPIDRLLYDSNPHRIIECIDCHENSTIPPPSDINHGKFIRQLNGSNVSGPLLSDYSKEKFDLCYYCHNETKVVGMAPGFIASANHINPNINISSIGTNFINIDPSGYHNGSPPPSLVPDIPTNIHWNHLDAFGSSNYGISGRFDSNMNGTIGSFQSCPACHNVHGTNYPKMTKNDLAITYGSDGNGTFGYIASDDYNRGGGDIYCTSCHTNGTTFKYYRNELNLYQDCISCHIDGVPGDVNSTAFSQGVHINISTEGGFGVVNNNDCWTCHYNRDMNKSNISQCRDCHVNASPKAPTAPKISTHISGEKITNYTCVDCHSKVIAYSGNGIVNVTSHYLKRPGIPSINYCDYCHGPNANDLFPARNKTIPEFNHDDKNWDGTTTCRTCHSNSSVPADPLANDSSSFHDLSTELGDVFNGTTRADCVICHIKNDTEFVLAPKPPLSHPDTSNMTLENCYVCHGSNRHNVAGSCINCHSINNTRYYVNTSLFAGHKNVNKSDGLGNITDDDCKTCHFGSANNSMPMNLGAANESNTFFCQDCHTATGRNRAQYDNMTNENLKKAPMPPGHGQNNCAQCHIPGFDKTRPLTDKVRYHTHGPEGFVE